MDIILRKWDEYHIKKERRILYGTGISMKSQKREINVEGVVSEMIQKIITKAERTVCCSPTGMKESRVN